MKNTTTKTSQTTLNKTQREDLCAMVRIGRLANVIAFTRRAYLDADNLNRRLCDRQKSQATFLLGGYLYEANYLLNDLREPYGMQAYFGDLLILTGFLNARHEILTAFSFSPAFHQDWQPKRTLEDLDKNTLDVESLNLDCYLGHNPDHLHFRQVLTFDTNNWMDQLLGKYDTDELCTFIADELHELSDAFLRGANAFIQGLSKKMLHRKRRSPELRKFKAD
jgi:hypothetical protein